MDAPRIQYAKTSDGVNIAHYVVGEGPPLVFMPTLMPFTSIYAEWTLPASRKWAEQIAKELTLVRYDNRGSGLSDRGVSDVSVDAMIRDLEAVADALGLHRFALNANGPAGPSAITFAVRHPQRVMSLILWETAASSAALLAGIPRLQPLWQLMERDWELFTETAAHVVLGWSEGEAAHAFAGLMREATTPEVAKAFLAAGHDASELLARVNVPTLVAHERGSGHHIVELAKGLAAGIPRSRLFIADVGERGMPSDESNRALIDFVRKGEGEAPEAATLPEGMTAILFADIADSTALTERLGDAAFRERARGLDSALRGVIREGGGTPIEGRLLGDGVLAVFTSARQAIDAALACGKAGEGAGLPLHLGLHAGDVIREEDPDGRANVYGGAVNIAARVSGLSAAGELLVSQTVRDLARTSAGVAFEDRGEHSLKGVGEPLRLWAVREG